MTSQRSSSYTHIKIFNILQGVGCITLASLADCSSIHQLVPVLFTLGCFLVTSGLFQLYFHIELASPFDSTLGLFINLVHVGTLTSLIWLAVLTWGESGRLWDGGSDCDGWIFNFVFIYTIIAAVEIGCMCIFLRADDRRGAHQATNNIV